MEWKTAQNILFRIIFALEQSMMHLRNRMYLIYKYYRRVEKNGRKDQNLIDI